LPDAGPLEAALAEGLTDYRAGRFWNAHHTWELAWRRLDSAERRWVQGLIMLSAAALHAERGRRGPAVRLLRRASQLLEGFTGARALALPVDLAARARAAAEATELPNPPVLLG